jgi:branched-chain amino acid transport system substrate-binding protein
VVGEVKGGRVVYAYEADRKGGSQLRTKQAAAN